MLRESQHSAIEQAAAARRAAAGRGLEGEPGAGHAVHEGRRDGCWTRPLDKPSAGSLHPALAAEQAAYQALLKLRAREFQVIRNNSRQRQGGGGSGGSPSQRQLDQLELSNDENRFEEQQPARPTEQALAAGARAARDAPGAQPPARAGPAPGRPQRTPQGAAIGPRGGQGPSRRTQEIERQLKRLREQQQQILRDTDELQRADGARGEPRAHGRGPPADEESREHVRQASEALEQGRLSQALTEGHPRRPAARTTSASSSARRPPTGSPRR